MKIPVLYIYTILGYTVLHTLTAISVLLSLLFNTVGWEKGVRFVILVWARGSFIIIGKRLNVEGRENLDKSRKYILMANHASMFDIMGVMSICPSVAWFGKAYLSKVPVFGKVLDVINYVPMQTTNLRNTKEMVNKLIQHTNNQTVAIFPEGTRTTDGELSRFRKGFLHVLKASELDILPVSLIGFYEFKPKNRFYFRHSAKLTAKIHPPILFNDLKDMLDNEIISMVQTKIESALPQYLSN